MNEEFNYKIGDKFLFRLTEEVIMNLEIYIDYLQENVNLYKQLINPKFTKKHQFISEYIELEDNIINAFDRLNYLKILPNQEKRLGLILQNFNLYCKDFLLQWDVELWEIYENVRKKGLSLKINLNYDDEINMSNKDGLTKQVNYF